jgi:hypothetical protein
MTMVNDDDDFLSQLKGMVIVDIQMADLGEFYYKRIPMLVVEDLIGNRHGVLVFSDEEQNGPGSLSLQPFLD